jgi:hypothetical protein
VYHAGSYQTDDELASVARHRSMRRLVPEFLEHRVKGLGFKIQGLGFSIQG